MPGYTRNVRGARISYKNIRDEFNNKDENGVYTQYTEYFDDDVTKFIEINLINKNEFGNYLSAKYTRYDLDWKTVMESKYLKLVYNGNILIDIDDYVINNDFIKNEFIENKIRFMINIMRMQSNMESAISGECGVTTKLICGGLIKTLDGWSVIEDSSKGALNTQNINLYVDGSGILHVEHGIDATKLLSCWVTPNEEILSSEYEFISSFYNNGVNIKSSKKQKDIIGSIKYNSATSSWDYSTENIGTFSISFNTTTGLFTVTHDQVNNLIDFNVLCDSGEVATVTSVTNNMIQGYFREISHKDNLPLKTLSDRLSLIVKRHSNSEQINMNDVVIENGILWFGILIQI